MKTDITQQRIREVRDLIELNIRGYRSADTEQKRINHQEALGRYSAEYKRLTGRPYRLREWREEC